MSCDSVEDFGKEIVKNCYDLHHKAKYDLIKERFLVLLMYAKRWRPICSAAGITLLMLIIKTCDLVEDCGEEIVKNCCHSHHNAKYDLIKERFLLLLMSAKL
nr:unnamed protein product [Callosobruchus chinensis]